MSTEDYVIVTIEKVVEIKSKIPRRLYNQYHDEYVMEVQDMVDDLELYDPDNSYSMGQECLDFDITRIEAFPGTDKSNHKTRGGKE